jgi:hypothetical protein
LHVPYNDFVAAGIGRRFINKAIDEAERRGLVIAERGGRKDRTANYLSKYTLTFVPLEGKDVNGRNCFIIPSDDWKRYRENRNEVLKGELGQVHLSTNTGAPFDNAKNTKAQKTNDSGSSSNVSKGEPLYNFGGRVPDKSSKPPPSKRILKTSGEEAVVGPPEAVAPDHHDRGQAGEVVPPALPEAAPEAAERTCGSHAGSNAPSMPQACPEHQIDLEDLLGTRASGPDPSTAVLRQDAKAWKDRVGKGALGRLAGVVSVSSPTMCNFIAGRFNLNRPARVALRDFLDQNQGDQS